MVALECGWEVWADVVVFPAGTVAVWRLPEA